ncbi:hypothetical protein BS78_K165700 [Paspalum vaginatum]|uniref:Uncharacterized protein n=1 Tax=Paspalum vaginatum TaxID=158149 RepID=A0A9W7XAV9_9POAL|nr:hypothetical protein BS78_K165700 [Paspalum vaginatum]
MVVGEDGSSPHTRHHRSSINLNAPPPLLLLVASHHTTTTSTRSPMAIVRGGRGGPGRPQIQRVPVRSEVQEGDGTREAVEEGQKEVKGSGVQSGKEKLLHVICFNFGDAGHVGSGCNRPRVCFICQSTAHLVDNYCPEWKKPASAAQYFGSANRGFSFYHVDVQPRGNRFRHKNCFDNYGVFSIKEGEIDEEGILENLKEFFDKE